MTVDGAAGRPRVTAAVLAGGVGTRMGGDLPKQLLPLAGRPVMAHSIAAYCAAPEVDEIVVLMVAEYLPRVEKLVSEGDFPKVTAVLPGGADRGATSWRAIEAVDRGVPDDVVLLHDAVRPLVSQRVISDCVAEARRSGAAGVAVPAGDTVVEVAGPEDGVAAVAGAERIARTPRRDRLRRMQTPQGFRVGTIRRAYELARADADHTAATDDCGVVLRYLPEVPVRLVAGEERNIKITHPGDLRVAAALLAGDETGGAAR